MMTKLESGKWWEYTSDECSDWFGNKDVSTPMFCDYLSIDWMLNASMYTFAGVAHLYFLCREKNQREQIERLFFIQTVYSLIMVGITRRTGVVEETTHELITRILKFMCHHLFFFRCPRKFPKP